VIKDWFHKSPLEEGFSLIQAQILAMIPGATWNPCHPGQAPGSFWCHLIIDKELKLKIEELINYRVYPDFYIWNYKNIKKLKVHRDTNDRGHSREVSGILPLIGDFKTEVYHEDDLTSPIDNCVYGPGEVLFLNNTRYYHGGDVLSETRLSLHFYLDFFNEGNKTLEQLLNLNRIS